MTRDLRWRVWRSRFPISAPTELLGYISAPNHRAAEIIAEKQYGHRVVVERCTRDSVDSQPQEIKP